MRGLNRLIAAAQNGALDAQIQYSKWSGGLGVVNSGVESFVSAKIAESIHNNLASTKKLFVGLEYPVQDIIEKIERRNRGRLGGRLEENGRVDVIVWDSARLPRVIIEVKRQFRWSAVQSDAERIRQFLKKFGSHLEGGTIEAGIIIIPFIKWKISGQKELYPDAEDIQYIEENANEMGFKMGKILYRTLEQDDEFKFPDKIIDEEEYEGKENIEYCSSCFTIKGEDIK